MTRMDPTVLYLIGGCGLAIGFLMASRAGLSLLTLFFLALPFPNSIIGEGGAGNISASDVLAGLALVVLFGSSQVRLGGAGQAVVAFLSVATVSSVMGSPAKEVALGLGRMGLVTLVPLLVFANASDPVRRLRQGLIAYCLSTAVLGCCSMYFFATGGIVASMYTFGIHKNALGPIFGSAVVITFAAITTGTFSVRRHMTTAYGVLAACAVGLLLCLSRGGWVGTAAGLLVVMACTGRFKPAMIMALLLVPLLAAVWSLLPEDKVEYATNVSTDSYVLRTRLDSMGQALEAFKSNPVLGVGIGLERRVEPHNVFVLTLGETGIAGLMAFTFMVGTGAFTLLRAVRQYQSNNPDRAVLLAGLGAFAVYHVQTLIDVYWRRGVGALSWACVGTAVAVTATQVRRPLPVPERPLRRPAKVPPQSVV